MKILLAILLTATSPAANSDTYGFLREAAEWTRSFPESYPMLKMGRDNNVILRAKMMLLDRSADQEPGILGYQFVLKNVSGSSFEIGGVEVYLVKRKPYLAGLIHLRTDTEPIPLKSAIQLRNKSNVVEVDSENEGRVTFAIPVFTTDDVFDIVVVEKNGPRRIEIKGFNPAWD